MRDRVDLLRSPWSEPRLLRGFHPGGLRPPFFARTLAFFRLEGPEEVIVFGSIGPFLAASNGSSSGGAFTTVLFIGFMFVIFYMLLIRPQRRRQQAQRQLIESLDVGDEVVTLGGMYGTIRALDDESVTLEVAPSVDIRFARGAIARKLVYDQEDFADEAPAGDEPEEEQEEEEEANQREPESRWRSGPWFRGRKGPSEGAGEQP